MWQPAVSVVLCTYNGEAFLKEQLDSILAQTYPLLEIIVCDDASTDSTWNILEAYALKNQMFKLYRNNQNIGYNGNFENALQQAQGEVIAFSDQDDIWHIQKIEKMIAAWDTSCPLIHCDSRRFTNKTELNLKRNKLYKRFSGTDSKKLYFINSVSGHAMLIQKKLVPLILPFQKDIYYDWWTAFVASCNGGVAYHDEVLVYQRIHEKNVSVTTPPRDRASRYAKDRNDIIRHIKKFITAPNLGNNDKAVGIQFYKKLVARKTFFQKLDLFFLMLRYRNEIFYTKKRLIPILSQVKHCYQMSFY